MKNLILILTILFSSSLFAVTTVHCKIAGKDVILVYSNNNMCQQARINFNKEYGNDVNAEWYGCSNSVINSDDENPNYMVEALAKNNTVLAYVELNETNEIDCEKLEKYKKEIKRFVSNDKINVVIVPLNKLPEFKKEKIKTDRKMNKKPEQMKLKKN